MRRLFRPLANWLRQARRFLWQRALPALSYLASYLRSPRQAVSIWPEDGIRVGPRVALFIHFDSRHAVQPHVLLYISALREAGLSVVFVTNSGRLRAEALAALRPLCAGVIVRRNVGYDFSAMREGIERAGLPRADTEMVLLVNDSVYGPLQPLGPVLKRLDFGRADIWGPTESWQTRYHLQSYFVAFGRAALASPAWAAFWRQVRPVGSKWWVIRNYEIGLTQWFLSAGLRARAVWRYEDLARQLTALESPKVSADEETDEDGYPVMLDPMLKGRLAQARHVRAAVAARLPLNPTSDFWRQLLLAEFPFVKRELLRLNPTAVGDLADWRDVVGAASSADLEPIERDLQRVTRDRAP